MHDLYQRATLGTLELPSVNHTDQMEDKSRYLFSKDSQKGRKLTTPIASSRFDPQSFRGKNPVPLEVCLPFFIARGGAWSTWYGSWVTGRGSSICDAFVAVEGKPCPIRPRSTNLANVRTRSSLGASRSATGESCKPPNVAGTSLRFADAVARNGGNRPYT